MQAYFGERSSAFLPSERLLGFKLGRGLGRDEKVSYGVAVNLKEGLTNMAANLLDREFIPLVMGS